ncbi:MAG: NupC/NupG family nucleoside CNT transporter [candidate division Zixibacteria bacterium]|nr:NupC/NupG family nucleoside CNT transporter [candidate division Zixibacteria bacterium]
MDRFVGILGLIVLLVIAWALSRKRDNINWRLVGWGIGLQFVFALLILKTGPGKWVFEQCNSIILAVLKCADSGSNFVFGNLIGRFVNVGTVESSGEFVQSQQLVVDNGMAFFAFSVLPTIIFFSALITILYHYGIMQKLVLFIAKIMAKTMKSSGSESLSAAANIFVGQTEAPLVVKPYIGKMTMSELGAIMTGGFATVAGGVMAAYVGLLKDAVPGIAGHLMAASIMSAPAGLVFAKLFMPETEKSMTAGEVKLKVEKVDKNGIDAASRGASDGLRLALNVGAMLIAFIALVTLVNTILGLFWDELSLAWIFGKVLAPLAWLMGVPWADCAKFGDILGTKIMINEFVAFMKLQTYAAALSPKAQIIGAYALCGFANLSSIGIQIGGISGIAPERRSDLAKLSIRAMTAGAFASWSTACIAGILL